MKRENKLYMQVVSIKENHICRGKKKKVEAYNKTASFLGYAYGLFLLSLKLSVISYYFGVGHRLMGRSAPFIF